MRSLDQKGLWRKGTYHHMQESFMCMFGYFSIIKKIPCCNLSLRFENNIMAWRCRGGHAAGVKWRTKWRRLLVKGSVSEPFLLYLIFHRTVPLKRFCSLDLIVLQFCVCIIKLTFRNCSFSVCYSLSLHFSRESSNAAAVWLCWHHRRLKVQRVSRQCFIHCLRTRGEKFSVDAQRLLAA